MTWKILYPFIHLTVFALLILMVEAFRQKGSPPSQRLFLWLALLGVATVFPFLTGPTAETGAMIGSLLVWDGLAYWMAGIVLVVLLFVILMTDQFRDLADVNGGVYLSLLLLAGVGLLVLVTANDFLMIFLGVELAGIPSFILAGYQRSLQRSCEAALKFFLIGAFSSAMLVFGLSLLYGLSGTTSLPGLQSWFRHSSGPTGLALSLPNGLLWAALFFVVVSLGFKMALVPFHMWVPDVFEGAPTPITAFLSVAPKVSGAAVALRVFWSVFPHPSIGFGMLLAVIVALTMTVANVIALQQTNIKRLLAYSSIAHMGYLLLGLVAGGSRGMASACLYAAVYLFMNLGAFAVVITVSNATGSEDIATYAGLSRRSPPLAFALIVFLLALSGIPPTAGFLAKFYVFAAAYDAGWPWLVALALLNSVISVGYYFRLAHQMFFNAPDANGRTVAIAPAHRLLLAASVTATLVLGLFPQAFLSTAQTFSGALWP